MNRIRLGPVVLLGVLLVGCARSAEDTAPTAAPSPSAFPAGAVTATATESPTPAREAVLQDLRATRLTIPALGIDAEIQRSDVITDTTPTAPGCPATPPGQETLTVPERGIATPEDTFPGLENKAWIFGHSRWQDQPGLFVLLEDINIGDELFVDGVDRQTGEQIRRQRYVVEGIYLADRGSGAELVTADHPAGVPTRSTVILQTSIRESGANKQWLLDQQKVLARASNLVDGDVDDPCKYLLLFVIARSS